MKQQEKRRRFPIVNRSIQYRFLAMVLTYGLLIVIFLALSLFIPDIIQMQDDMLNVELRARAADKILFLHSRVWPAVIALICLIGLHSFRAFHRLIGPLYRFCWAFDKLQHGDLSFRVRIREKDYLHQEEDALNDMIDSLEQNVGRIQSASLETQKAFEALEDAIALDSSWGDVHKERFNELRHILEALVKSTQYFQVQQTARTQNATTQDQRAPGLLGEDGVAA